MLKAVIFDLDGTLIDSEPVWDLVFAEIVVQEGKSYESEVHQKFLGKGVEIVGKFDLDQVFCEALICQCDDYILVESIKIPE